MGASSPYAPGYDERLRPDGASLCCGFSDQNVNTSLPRRAWRKTIRQGNITNKLLVTQPVPASCVVVFHGNLCIPSIAHRSCWLVTKRFDNWGYAPALFLLIHKADNNAERFAAGYISCIFSSCFYSTHHTINYWKSSFWITWIFICKYNIIYILR